jgi:hypothetical protein
MEVLDGTCGRVVIGGDVPIAILHIGCHKPMQGQDGGLALLAA